MEIGNEPVDRIVCADESAVNILTSYRRNSRAMKGVRARKRCRFVRGTRLVPNHRSGCSLISLQAIQCCPQSQPTVLFSVMSKSGATMETNSCSGWRVC
ncbi:hypothetical protein K438DRAFT_1015345 [Mycena galopus ATCC 62051]|nr:hypothetical protein K438DRAFT_1014957 [Mycena galopus ATCC 62051]KAF8187346.1 hypothetical protein K438DRAFT_1015345 [Mycena galopus ATCC 62051]